MEDTKVTVYELEEMPNGRRRIGNSIEVPLEEALMLVEQKQAKFPDAPIGHVPERFTQKTSEKAQG